MKNILKLLVVVLLLATMTFVLVACGETEDAGTDVDPGVVVDPNTTYYNVTYKLSKTDTTAYYTEKVAEGAKANGPAANPTKEGYNFKGWKTALAQMFNLEKKTITENVVLYASFSINTYEVKFVNEAGETVYTEDEVEWDTDISLPTKKDYYIVQLDNTDLTHIKEDKTVVVGVYKKADYDRTIALNLASDLRNTNFSWNQDGSSIYMFTNTDQFSFRGNYAGEIKLNLAKGVDFDNFGGNATISSYVDGVLLDQKIIKSTTANGMLSLGTIATGGMHTVTIKLEAYTLQSGYAYNGSGIEVKGIEVGVYKQEVAIVTFVDQNSQTIGTQRVYHGEDAFLFSTYNTTFTANADDLKAIKADKTINVTSSPKKYTLTFKTPAGAVVSTVDNHLATDAVTLPTQYVLDSDTNLTYCLRDWTFIVIKDEELTVTFKDIDGNVVGTATCRTRGSVSLPEVAGYVIQQRDTKDLTKVYASMDVLVGKYDLTNYSTNTSSTINVKTEATSVADWNDTYDSVILYQVNDKISFTQNVKGTAKIAFAKGGTTFTTFAIQAKLVVYVDGEKVKEISIDKNTADGLIEIYSNVQAGIHTVDIILEEYAATAQTGYGQRDSGIVISGIYAERYQDTHTVTFIDEEEQTVYTQTVHHGEPAFIANLPGIEIYDYNAKAIKSITTDKNVVIEYKAKKYEVTFIKSNGAKVSSVTKKLGENAAVPSGYELVYGANLTSIRCNLKVVVTKVLVYSDVNLTIANTNAAEYYSNNGVSLHNIYQSSKVGVVRPFTTDNPYIEFNGYYGKVGVYMSHTKKGITVTYHWVIDGVDDTAKSFAASSDGKGTWIYCPTITPGEHVIRFVVDSYTETESGLVNNWNGIIISSLLVNIGKDD